MADDRRDQDESDGRRRRIRATRARGPRSSPHSAAAAMIDGPMMLRMSTFSIDHAGARLRR